MYDLIKIEPEENGSHLNLIGYPTFLDGYAVIPQEIDKTNTFPYVDIEVKYLKDDNGNDVYLGGAKFAIVTSIRSKQFPEIDDIDDTQTNHNQDENPKNPEEEINRLTSQINDLNRSVSDAYDVIIQLNEEINILKSQINASNSEGGEIVE